MPGRVCKHTRTPCLLVSFGVSLLEKLRHMYVPIIPTRTILTNKIQVFQKYTSVRGVNQPLWGIGDHTLTRRPIRPRELIGGWAEVRVTWQEWTIKALTSGRPPAFGAGLCPGSFVLRPELSDERSPEGCRHRHGGCRPPLGGWPSAQ